MEEKLKSVRWGSLLAILTILFGFSIGVIMGGAEEAIKHYWKELAQPGLATLYQNDPQKITALVDRCWRMLLRAHLHGAAIGTAMLILNFVLACLNVGEQMKKWASLALGLGGLGYACSWLLVAFQAPVVGSIPAAKATIHLLAAPSIALMFFGVAVVLVFGVKTLFKK
ncbi:MAG: hypothetical protein E6713_01895 [Sporomusaceae bacterium]|nr:hypothetical protein [Sporomusaceae bacterium]